MRSDPPRYLTAVKQEDERAKDKAAWEQGVAAGGGGGRLQGARKRANKRDVITLLGNVFLKGIRLNCPPKAKEYSACC